MDKDASRWSRERVLARSAYACHQARELRETAFQLIWECERECDFAALLVVEARAVSERGVSPAFSS